MAKRTPLSTKSVAVLTLIAEGCSYSQIVDGHAGITYVDIFKAAEEALAMNDGSPADYHARLAEIKKKYPRAYEKWSEAEDAELGVLYDKGVSNTKMAVRFQRQPSAIRSRITNLGLDTRTVSKRKCNQPA